MSEYAEKLQQWYDNEVKNGAKDLKIFPFNCAENTTVESFSKEFLEAINTPVEKIDPYL